METVESLENSTDPQRSTSLSNAKATRLKCASFPSSLTISHIDGDTPSSETDGNSCNNGLQTPMETNCKAIAAIQEIVCYGLGNFLSSVTARYQLALLLLLMERLQVITTVNVFFIENYSNKYIHFIKDTFYNALIVAKMLLFFRFYYSLRKAASFMIQYLPIMRSKFCKLMDYILSKEMRLMLAE